MEQKILVIGSEGQLGTELVEALQAKYGKSNVVCSDIRNENVQDQTRIFERVDVLNQEKLDEIIKEYKITQIYHLAAMLSAKGEQYPKFAWKLNIEGLLNVLDASVANKIQRIYWPSSIAVFGNKTPKNFTPQDTVVNPNTVYGLSKFAGELWCQYYYEKHQLDIRSLRYPGIISYRTPPGGGTTDYAVEIFFEALEKGEYTCFLSENQALPMMYIDVAVRATIEIMEADTSLIKERTSYNLAGVTFTPAELAEEIKKHVPDFRINYNIDHREQIAESWSNSIDDSAARNDWGWKHKFDLTSMTKTMIAGLSQKRP